MCSLSNAQLCVHGPTGPLTYISVAIRFYISFLFPFCNKMTIQFRTLLHRAAGAEVGVKFGMIKLAVLVCTMTSNAKIRAKRRTIIILIVRISKMFTSTREFVISKGK